MAIVTPRAARSLAEIRRAIDRIDRRLVPLLAARGRWVLAAARFKRTQRDVRAPRRAARVIANARRLARRHGLDPKLAGRLWRAMISGFVARELAEHRRLRRARRTRKETRR